MCMVLTVLSFFLLYIHEIHVRRHLFAVNVNVDYAQLFGKPKYFSVRTFLTQRTQ
jgi:hypothetical protein